jgi:hypothetical protein
LIKKTNVDALFSTAKVVKSVEKLNDGAVVGQEDVLECDVSFLQFGP